MSRNAVETVMGAVVLVVAAVFLFFAYSTSEVRATTGTSYTARFSRLDGIRDGTDVRVNGVKVGSVVSQWLDPKDFYAYMNLSVDPNFKFGKDSVVSIKMNGLLGEKYVDIEPSYGDDILAPGGRFEHTQAGMDLERIISETLFGVTSKKEGGGTSAPALDASGAPAPESGNAPAAPKP